MSAPEPQHKAEKSAGPAVALVLDPEFGERLQGLVEHAPIWALNSTTNRAATEWLWEKEPDTRKRITLFDVPDYPLDTQEFIGVVASIVAQRGKHGDPPLQDVEVIGMELFPDLNGALLEFGFQGVEPTVRGFKALGLRRT
ncbi:MAG TPA: hypothetical protein VMS96_11415 [Terriglobales bacterium]|nr:hypothetical protein [Terriglobales bacterium]